MKKALRVPKVAVVQMLKQLEIDEVEITYDGSGDSGQINEVNISESKQGVEIDPDTTRVTMPEFKVEYDKKTYQMVGIKASEPKEMSLTEALHDFAYLMIDACGHSGYENNEGGDGRLTIDVKKGTAKLVHNDNVVTQETTEDEL